MCVGMLMSAPTMSAAQTREAETQSTVEGTVDAVDHANRTVTIRSKDGNVVTLDVPPEAMRFDQVKVGTPVMATYYNWISVRLKPAGEPPVDRTDPPNTIATPGSLPGATKFRTRVATVTITGWDPVNKVLTFTGPNGLAYTRRLLDTTDPKIAEGLKKGDRVDVTRLEAVTLTVSQQTVAVSAQSSPDTLRNRLTVSVLYRGGQPVQRQDDPGGHRPDNRGSGNQPGRDHVRRSVWPRRDVQGRRRLSDDSTHRGRLQLRVVQQ